MTKYFKISLYLILLITIVVIFIPFKMKISPRREYNITDSDHNPIIGALVRQYFDQYSIDYHGITEVKSDKNGKVFLKEQIKRTNIWFLMLGAFKSICRSGVHADIGTFENTMVFADGYEDKNIYCMVCSESEKRIESGIIIMEKKQ